MSKFSKSAAIARELARYFVGARVVGNSIVLYASSFQHGRIPKLTVPSKLKKGEEQC